MNWAHYAIEGLQAGKSVTITPHGNSMKGKVEDGDTVVLVPVNDLSIGDIVLVRCKSKVYLHLIIAIRMNGDKIQYQIGNNKGGINGWVSRNAIYGVAISINGRRL